MLGNLRLGRRLRRSREGTGESWRGVLRFACARRGAPINVPQNSVAKNDPFARLKLENSMRQTPRARIWRMNFAVCAIRQATQKSENLTRGATGVPSRLMS